MVDMVHHFGPQMQPVFNKRLTIMSKKNCLVTFLNVIFCLRKELSVFDSALKYNMLNAALEVYALKNVKHEYGNWPLIS
jgi:hypothetical protein